MKYLKKLDKYKFDIKNKLYNFASKVKYFLYIKTDIFIYRKKKNSIFNSELILDDVDDRKSAFLELAINREMSHGWSGLIQIGAGGPETADFLEKFVIKYNLKSFFIDGDQRTLYEKSKRINKKVKNQSKYINKWISAESEQRTLYKFKNQTNNLSGFTTLSKEDFLVNAKSNSKEETFNESIKTTSIIEIAKTFCNNNISLLALDCEGLDYEILMKLMDNNIYPNIIVIEILSFKDNQIKYLVENLIKKKYIVYPDISDMIAVKI